MTALQFKHDSTADQTSLRGASAGNLKNLKRGPNPWCQHVGAGQSSLSPGHAAHWPGTTGTMGVIINATEQLGWPNESKWRILSFLSFGSCSTWKATTSMPAGHVPSKCAMSIFFLALICAWCLAAMHYSEQSKSVDSTSELPQFDQPCQPVGWTNQTEEMNRPIEQYLHRSVRGNAYQVACRPFKTTSRCLLCHFESKSCLQSFPGSHSFFVTFWSFCFQLQLKNF